MQYVDVKYFEDAVCYAIVVVTVCLVNSLWMDHIAQIRQLLVHGAVGRAHIAVCDFHRKIAVAINYWLLYIALIVSKLRGKTRMVVAFDDNASRFHTCQSRSESKCYATKAVYFCPLPIGMCKQKCRRFGLSSIHSGSSMDSSKHYYTRTWDNICFGGKWECISAIAKKNSTLYIFV